MNEREEIIIDGLLAQWKAAIARGEDPSITMICREHPELKEQLQAKIDGLFLDRTQLFPRDASDDTLNVTSEISRLSFHAKGGLGTVYRAQEAGVNREVAVKFIHPSLSADNESCDRFALEAEVTGRLEHPGVVPLYGIGQTEDGRMFYYMRFIDGETLDDAISRYHQNRPKHAITNQSVEFRRLLGAFVAVCKTIAYAHNRGIVHRDVKPSNVMLGRYGETIVVDWGLATSVARDPRFAASGEVSLRPASGSLGGASSGLGAGTVAYMSPEQASDLVSTPASDIYSLGATLYKILTGETSVTGDQLSEVKRKIVDGNIVTPKKRLSSVPSALEAICLHAMALHPQSRYQTALELADDVENYLADAKISVFEEPWSRRLARWARKNRLAAQTVLAGFLAVLVVTIVAAILQINLRQDADKLRDEADKARESNLKSSARFLAESLAGKIDKRWLVLESERSSPTLQRLVTSINGERDGEKLEEERNQLQSWLDDCSERNDVFNVRGDVRPSDTIWGILSIHGELLAREPEGKSITGKFAFRDYFHGKGHDLEEGTHATPFEFVLPHLTNKNQISQAASVSVVFRSQATETLMVTFSVPIWDGPDDVGNRTAIGVFSISSELHHFELPKNALIFQSSVDQLSKRPGKVIFHPQLGPQKEGAESVYIAPALSEQAQKLSQHRTNYPDDPSKLSLVEDFLDPLEPDGMGLAAIEPVVVRTRPRSIRETSWVVLVKEDVSP